MTETATNIRWVEIDRIEEPLHLLRTADTESVKFKETLESMRLDGFWPSKPLDVSLEMLEGGDESFILNDGMQRLTCAKVLGLTRVPVVVCERNLSEAERLERSIVANATTIPTKPVEFSKGLAKLVELNEGITMVDLAKRVRKEPAWVSSMLRLAKLDGAAADLVNDGKIGLANGQALVEVQRAGVLITKDLLEKAERENVAAFAEIASDIIAKYRSTKPKRPKGPVPKLRPVSDVKDEMERAKNDPHTHPAYLEALRWATRTDAVSSAAEGIEPEPETPKPKPEEAEPGVLLDIKNRIHTLAHWALGAGADPSELDADLRALVEEANSEVVRAIGIITVPVLAKKTGSKDVGRWLKGDRSPSYAHRKTILETVREPMYRNLLEKS